MKSTSLILLCPVLLTTPAHAEVFSSSTNSIATLTLAPGEATIITTLKTTSRSCASSASIRQSNNVYTVPIFLTPGNCSGTSLRVHALAGPMQIQFQDANVLMEHQRIQTTSLFTAFFGTNRATVDVPPGETINFFTPTSWYSRNGQDTAFPSAYAILSNSVAVLSNALFGGETFSGPLSISLVPANTVTGNATSNAWVSYYFSEGFTTIPGVPATAIPPGKAQVLIQRSRDLTNWGTVFLGTVTDDQSGFYRLNITK